MFSKINKVFWWRSIFFFFFHSNKQFKEWSWASLRQKQILIFDSFIDSARRVRVRAEGERRSDLHHHRRARPSRVDGLAPRSSSAVRATERRWAQARSGCREVVRVDGRRTKSDPSKRRKVVRGLSTSSWSFRQKMKILWSIKTCLFQMNITIANKF